MNKIVLTAFVACVVFMAGSGTAVAQDDGMKVIPVELIACTYNDRKGPADLDRWVDKWTAWADRNDIDYYAAWTLTPFYYGPGQNSGFDFVWMGAAKNAVVLGEGNAAYIATNDGLQDELGEIATCGSRANFASINFKAPPADNPPDGAVLTMSDCSFESGATFAALGTAMEEWSQYMSSAGSDAGYFHWYPQYGGGGETFDFKWMTAHASLADLGADYEVIGNGRGFETRGRLLNHLVDCDSARAYLAENRRFTQLR
ncbi:MAG: hypothetical protein ACR2PZ_00740 [Pseudomonadales bacterium]